MLKTSRDESKKKERGLRHQPEADLETVAVYSGGISLNR